jgi:chaperone modulatory protein CbpM
MTTHLTEEEVLAAIPTLTRTRLVAFIQTELVIPLREDRRGDSTHLFRKVDFARLQLLCDLTDDLELDAEALGIVVTLLDQLHAERQDLLEITRAVAAESPEVRARIAEAMMGSKR